MREAGKPVKEPLNIEDRPWSFLHDKLEHDKLDTVHEISAEANMTSKITPEYNKEESRVEEMFFNGALQLLSNEVVA